MRSNDHPSRSACNLGPTGKLLRRALPTIHAPDRFRAELRRLLIDAPLFERDALAGRMLPPDRRV
jgi:hypothetical protein